MTVNKAGGHGHSEDPMHGLSLCPPTKLMFMNLHGFELACAHQPGWGPLRTLV